MDDDKTDIRGWENGDVCFAVVEFVIKLLPLITVKAGCIPLKPVSLDPEVGKQHIIVGVCCHFLRFIRYYKKGMNAGKT